LLIGGLIAYFVSTRSKEAALNKERKERGTLLASGFIAGGALMGVVSAALRFGGINFVNEAWYASNAAEILAIVMFSALCGYLIWESMRKNKI